MIILSCQLDMNQCKIHTQQLAAYDIPSSVPTQTFQSVARSSSGEC